MLTGSITRIGRSVLVAFALVVAVAGPGAAQDARDDQRIAVSAGFDLLNQYMFRGIRQNSNDIVLWPSVQLTATAFTGDGALKGLFVGVGSWNSLNTGDTGSGGPSGKLWYESRVSANASLRFGGGVSVGTAYTAYTSPNEMFTTVKELSVRLDVDDRVTLGRGALRPYALVAFELDTQSGIGQLDGGLHAGRYLELGVSPGYAATRLRLAVPIKVGLSLSNYYELASRDHTFGFFSVGGILTVPIIRSTTFGSLDVHGGADFQAFGDATQVFNGGDRRKVVGLVGVGLSF